MKSLVVLLGVIIFVSFTVNDAYAIDYFVDIIVGNDNHNDYNGKLFLGTYNFSCVELTNQQLPPGYTIEMWLLYQHEVRGNVISHTVNTIDGFPQTLEITDEFTGQDMSVTCRIYDTHHNEVATQSLAYDYPDIDYDGIADWNDPDPNTPITRPHDRSHDYPNSNTTIDFANSQMRIDYDFSNWVTSNSPNDNPQCHVSWWHNLDTFNSAFFPNGTRYFTSSLHIGLLVPCEGYIIMDIGDLFNEDIHGFTFTPYLNSTSQAFQDINYLDEIMLSDFSDDSNKWVLEHWLEDVMLGWPQQGYVQAYTSKYIVTMDPDTLRITYHYFSPSDDPNYVEQKKKSGGCSGDCVAPIFGKDDTGRMIVQGGFSFNGNVTDVTNYHTPYHMITAQTNSTHNFTLKAFENYGNNNIKWFQFGIVPEVGSPLNDAEVLATIYTSSSKVENIVEDDKNNLFDIINATSYSKECGYVASDCLELSIDVIFREELRNKVIVIQAMDTSRNAETKFLNDGIETFGESLNEPLIAQVSVSKGGVFYPQDKGIVELTLTSYKNDLWQDKYGYEWTSDDYKSFRIIDTIPVPIKEPDVMWQAMTRMNSNFADMINYEQDKAYLILDEFCPHCNDVSFEEIDNIVQSDISIRLDRSDNQELQKAIIAEQHRAQLILKNVK